MSTTIRHMLHVTLAVLLSAGVTYCSEPLPTINPVQSIELAAFDSITSDSAFQGLVVVMASWCPPCRKELPVLKKLYDQYKGDGIQIVALSVDAGGPKAVQPLIDELKVTFPVYWAGMPAVQHYKISGIPLLMAFSKGKLVQKLPGTQSASTIEKLIKSLLAKTG
ncbi:MAG: TlpA disulfide reductase family protein [Desulfobacteraceae bacterium]